MNPLSPNTTRQPMSENLLFQSTMAITSAKTSHNLCTKIFSLLCSLLYTSSNTTSGTRTSEWEWLNHNRIERKFSSSYIDIVMAYRLVELLMCVYKVCLSFIRFNGNLVFSYLRAIVRAHANPCVHSMTIIKWEWKREKNEKKIVSREIKTE